MPSAEWRSHRDNYYRRAALDVGVPDQFIDDAVHEIAQYVEAKGQRFWKANVRTAAIDQARKWALTRTQHKQHITLPQSLDQILEGRDIPGDDDADDGAINWQDRHRAVTDILRALPARNRAIMQLYLDGWRDYEIAEVFEVSERRVGMLRQAAILELRTALEPAQRR